MIYVHLIKERRSDKLTVKCGLSFNPQNKTNRLETTIWADNVTCPGCRGGG